MKGRKMFLLAAALTFFFVRPPALCAEDREEYFTGKRAQMVERDIKGRGIKDPLVLGAMMRVKRHTLVDPSLALRAYDDNPLPIGEGQTISQPYIVALMTQALSLTGSERVLEIGTGSGYQAAVLAEIVKEVYTIEIKADLSRTAEERLKRLGYKNINFRIGDGFQGWVDKAPFDAIIITASTDRIPPPLIAQLKEGGRLILPLGSTILSQELTLATKIKGKLVLKSLAGVIFVPMTGEAQKK